MKCCGSHTRSRIHPRRSTGRQPSIHRSACSSDSRRSPGFRANEVAALRVGRVNPLLRRVEVADSVAELGGELHYGPPKTYQRRSVPIPATIALDLARHLELRGSNPDAFVFTAPEGGPLRHANFYRRHYKPAVVRAGVDPRTRSTI
jgi:hypothetical protein